MPDLAALMQAVVDAPTEDAPRAAYARAVAATDPERAELIDIQLELARARRAHSLDRQPGLIREEMLTRKNGARWAGDVRPLVDAWVFERGFVEEVKLDAARFLTVAPELYRCAPVLHLDLTGVKPVATELFRSRHLARIRSLSLLRNGLGDTDVAMLAASLHLTNLWWLDLGLNKIGAAGLEMLAASRNLPRLGYVGFRTNAIPDPTPQHADEWDATSPVGKELQRKYGPRPWLDAHRRWQWPPPRDAVD